MVSQSERGTQVVVGPSAVLEARLRVQSPVRPRGERGAVSGCVRSGARPGRAALRGGAWCQLAVEWRVLPQVGGADAVGAVARGSRF
jgi:hypothetical protein